MLGLGSGTGLTSGVPEVRGHSLVPPVARRGGQDLLAPVARREKLH